MSSEKLGRAASHNAYSMTVFLYSYLRGQKDIQVWRCNIQLKIWEKGVISYVYQILLSKSALKIFFLLIQQILCLAEQIKFTEDVENAIQDHSLHQIETQLVKKLEHYTDIDTSAEDLDDTGRKKCSVFCLLFSYLNTFWILC